MGGRNGLPCDLAAEQAVLGAALLDETVLRRLVEAGLIGEDFYHERHRFIFQAMGELADVDGAPVDPVTVDTKLLALGVHEKVGGAAYLSELLDGVGTAKNVEYYARVLIEKGELRRIVLAARQIQDLAAAPGANLAEIMDFAQAVFGVSNVGSGQQCQQDGQTSAAQNRRQQSVSNFVSIWGADPFTAGDVFSYLGTRDRAEKNAVYQALSRMVKAGEIERCSKIRGGYRRVNNDLERIDFRNAMVKTDPIHLPFGLEKLVSIQPGDVIVLAGDSGSGKTTLALNIVYINNSRYEKYKSKISYFSSEIRAAGIKERLEKFDLPLNQWDFEAFSRSDNFQDVIDPDGLNIVDYLEFTTSEFFKVAEYLRAIHDKLKTGVAVVCLQKTPGQDVGRGGALSLEKPALYLSVSRHPESGGILKVVKARNWATDVSPIGMEARYNIIGGANLLCINAWARPEGRRR